MSGEDPVAGVCYQIICSITGHTYCSRDARTVWPTPLQAVVAYNDGRGRREPAYAAQTRWQVKAFKVHTVK